MLGKENLFFRWIEILQYESSQPGGLTSTRKANAINKAREVFETQNIDFDDFATSIGGIASFPGLDSAT